MVALLLCVSVIQTGLLLQLLWRSLDYRSSTWQDVSILSSHQRVHHKQENDHSQHSEEMSDFKKAQILCWPAAVVAGGGEWKMLWCSLLESRQNTDDNPSRGEAARKGGVALRTERRGRQSQPFFLLFKSALRAMKEVSLQKVWGFWNDVWNREDVSCTYTHENCYIPADTWKSRANLLPFSKTTAFKMQRRFSFDSCHKLNLLDISRTLKFGSIFWKSRRKSV